jgi:hypothetical protein
MSDTHDEEAVLRALGWPNVAPAPRQRTMRLLLQPAFDPASCLIVEDGGSGFEMILAILREGSLLHDHFLAERRDPSGVPTLSVPQEARWEDIAALTPAHAERVRALYARTPPSTLADVALGACDGILVQLQSWGPEGEHAVRMWSPTPSQSPAHHDWVVTLVDVARAQFSDAYAQDYLARLRRYLGA